jgi:F-type H+-transporting ATPase subunit 8
MLLLNIQSIYKLIHNNKMPQFTPFYFINEVTFTFAIITITVYFLSKYIFPRFVRLFLSRTFISKLLDTSKNK